MPSRSRASSCMGRMRARCAISMLLGKGAGTAAGVLDMGCCGLRGFEGLAMLPEAHRAFAFCAPAWLQSRNGERGKCGDVVAQSFPRCLRSHLVRGAVLP